MIFAFSQQNHITITQPYTITWLEFYFFCESSTQQDSFSFIAYKESSRAWNTPKYWHLDKVSLKANHAWFQI